MLYSLYNVKTNVFSAIFEAPDDETACKNFVSILGNPQPSIVKDYIDEYSLYCIGDFDKDTGCLSQNHPVSILSGLTAVKMYKDRKKMLDELYGNNTITPSPSGDEDVVDLPEFVKEKECQ